MADASGDANTSPAPIQKLPDGWRHKKDPDGRCSAHAPRSRRSRWEGREPALRNQCPFADRDMVESACVLFVVCCVLHAYLSALSRLIVGLCVIHAKPREIAVSPSQQGRRTWGLVQILLCPQGVRSFAVDHPIRIGFVGSLCYAASTPPPKRNGTNPIVLGWQIWMTLPRLHQGRRTMPQEKLQAMNVWMLLGLLHPLIVVPQVSQMAGSRSSTTPTEGAEPAGVSSLHRRRRLLLLCRFYYVHTASGRSQWVMPSATSASGHSPAGAPARLASLGQRSLRES